MSETTSSSQQVQQQQPRLVRRDEGSVIAGVCSGLGAYTGIDPVVWRVGFVVFGLTSIGVLAYIVLWLVMPKARPGEPVPVHSDQQMDAARWVGIGAIVLGALVAFRGIFGFFDFFHGGVFWGLVLIAVGVAIWGRDNIGGPFSRAPLPPQPPQPPAPPQQPQPPQPPQTTPDVPSDPSTTTPPAAVTRPIDPPVTPPPPGALGSSSMRTTPMASRPAAPSPSPVPRKPRREPSILGRLVVGAAALAIGGALLLENLGLVTVTPKGVLAVLLGIVGAGLLVGTWAGRARWLIAPGIILSLLFATVALIPFNLRGGWGELAWTPETVGQIEPRYEHSAGQAALDLSEVHFGRKDREIDVRLGFGELYIVLPDEPDVRVVAHVQGGEIDLFGRTNEGWDISQRAVEKGEKGAGTVTINTQVTFGELHLLRGTSADVPGLVNDRFSQNVGGNFGSNSMFQGGSR